MTNTLWAGLVTVSSVFLRLALGISFLSAVADRFGLWGVYGQPNVAWGNYARFVAYTAKLNWFLPATIIRRWRLSPRLLKLSSGFPCSRLENSHHCPVKRSSSDRLCTDDDNGFGSESAPRFVGLFSCRRRQELQGDHYGRPENSTWLRSQAVE